MVKVKITIAGQKVHDVGYRYFLMNGARVRGIQRFDAINLTDAERQLVEVKVDGRDDQVGSFVEFAKSNKPKRAVVSEIVTSDSDEEVPKVAEYAQILTAEQMVKAIPVLLEVRDFVSDLPEIKEYVRDIPKIKEYVSDIPQIKGFVSEIPQMSEDLKSIAADAKILVEG